MSDPGTSRFFVTVALAAVTAGCVATSDSRVVGLEPIGSASISASDISATYLPVAAGVQLSGFSPVASAGGYIFTNAFSATGAARPYVWRSPYTSEPVAMAAEGFSGRSANDRGDVSGTLNGPGYWAYNGSEWRFVPVKVGAYLGVGVSGVNNARVMVGYGNINGAPRALWWANELAEPVELPLPPLTGNCTGTRAYAINNVGDIVGEVREQIVVGRKTQSRIHAVIWKPSAAGYQPILLKDVTAQDVAYDVNDAGQVAGNSSGSAVLWSPSNGAYGAAVVVSPSQGALSRVDRCGRVVGYTQTNTPAKRRAWMWEKGVLTELPMPAGATASLATAITTELTTGGEGLIAGGAIPSGQGNNNVNSAFVPVLWRIPPCPS
jgi:hypothetical protein